MKKNGFISLLFILLIHFSVDAQEFKAGMLAGAVFSQVDGDSYDGFNKFGAVGGLYVSHDLFKDWLAQLEIVYKQKGSKFTGDESIGDYSTYDLKLDYIEIPLIIKVNLNKVAFEGGFAFGSLIRSSEKDEFGDVNASIPFEDYEWSSLVGINYQFHEHMFANIRWSYSLSRIRKAYGGIYDDTYPQHWSEKKAGQYSHTVSLSVYYEFDKLFSDRY